jgi:hypothetical protein
MARLRGVAAVAWSALLASAEREYENSHTSRYDKKNDTETKALKFCNALLALKSLTRLRRRMLVPLKPSTVQLGSAQGSELANHASQNKLNC